MKYTWEEDDVKSGTLFENCAISVQDNKYMISKGIGTGTYSIIALSDGLCIRNCLTKQDVADHLNDLPAAPVVHTEHEMLKVFGRG